MTETEKHTYLRTHEIRGDALSLDLDHESTSILEAAKETDSGRAAKTLVKEGPLRLTIMGFAAGSALHEHKAAGPVSIEVRSGLVEVRVGATSSSLAAGDILILDEEISHSLVAASDAVLLLTIAISEKPKRAYCRQILAH